MLVKWPNKGSRLLNTEVKENKLMGDLTLENVTQLLARQTKDITNNIERISNRTDGKLFKLQRRCVTLERKIRKNNIVLFGLDLTGTDFIARTIEQLNELFGLNLTSSDINNIYRVGKSNNPPVIVEFVSFLKKKEIFKDVTKLKSLKTRNIAVSNDLCYEDREEQKVLRRHYRLAKEKNLQTKIKGHKLEIEGKLYAAGDLEQPEYETVSSESEEEEEEEQLQTQASASRGNDRTDTATKNYRYKDKRRLKTPSPQTAQIGIVTRRKKRARRN